ncbi:sensor histidine kinase [Arachnia propionica]|uniref:Sensor-like histidine kinase SenX3 n=1 Tax=Arachnia propionica TaxID=1750 RepID=A0A3P1TBV0_9ACTN|nr:HAMP domain-containing sensor histidine kinase [Arachnia propionica]RRD06356.1 sensor histidine kinase [Arachnia propionica]
MRGLGWAWLIAALGLVLGLGMMFAGERRVLRLGLDLWGVPVIVGAVVLILAWGVTWRREQLERAVERARSEARTASREEHRTFVGRLDHELKNPLTALRMGIAEVRPADLATSLQGQVERLSSLVAELRKISEIDAYPVADEAVDVSEVIGEVIETVVPEDRDVQLAFPRAPRPLPPVRGDRDLVFLALYNIIGNAVKYSQFGATLEIRGTEDRGMAVIDVADTGQGIRASEVEQVWGELSRGKDVRHIPGNGLGLPMVAAVLRRLGGECELSSIHGKGTTVRIRLPLA